MTNYEQFFFNQMQDPQFAKAYYEARMERIVNDMLDVLKDKISHNEPKENLIQMINALQENVHVTVAGAQNQEIHGIITC